MLTALICVIGTLCGVAYGYRWQLTLLDYQLR